MINTNYSTNVDGALKLIQINGSKYQLGKDASNTEGGIAKLFSNFETYKASTDGAYNAKVVYDELKDIKDAIGGDGETSLSSQIEDINDIIGTIESGHTVAGDIASAAAAASAAQGDVDALETRMDTAEGAISTLTAGSSTAGSVAYQIAQIVNENQNGSIDTLNEIAAWIVNDTTGAAKMAADITALQTAVGAVDYSGKADKVASATSGNFAGLDANGNLTDSGSKASDFATAAQGALAATAVQDASYVHTDNNYTTAEKSKLAAVSASVSGDTLSITTQASA
jgi:hypothetical protein